MIKRLFNKQINSITIAAIIIAFSSLVSRLLGILRDRILAGQFGAGATLDVYYAAFRVPDFIFNILVMGALTAGLIPVFTGLIDDYKDGKLTLFSNNNKEAWKLINNILNLMMISLAVLSVICVIFAEQLMSLVAPGFSDSLRHETAGLARIMFLSPIFLGVSSIFGGILQSFKRFFAYSLAPIMYNIGIIMGAIFFVPVLGISGLAWGVAFGALLHLIIQMPSVFVLDFKYKFFIDLADKNLRKLLKMMVPRTMTLGITQINLMAITAIASTLAGGSLAIFNFANNLQSFPIGIFGISFAVAAFPALAAAAWSKEKTAESFSQVMRQILFFIVPSTVLILILRVQITRVVLGSGKFTWEDTILTMNTLGFFAISLFAQATIPLLIRVFYARQDSKTPFFIGLVSVVANIVLSIFLAPRYGVVGLALAFSISSIINFILLWIFLHQTLGNLGEAKILISTVKFSIAAIVGGYVAQAMKGIVWPFINMTKFWGVLVQGLAAGIACLLAYLLICYLLRSEELSSFWQSLKSRMFKMMAKKRPASPDEA